MASDSYTKPQLGASPKLPKKILPVGKASDGSEYPFVLSEKEKEQNDFFEIKRLVYYYEWIARQQVNIHRNEITKKFNLAYGIIDPQDYVPTSEEYAAELTMLGGESLDFDLKFYPIIPNIVNTLVSELSKQYINYSAIAVNPEAVNQVLEEKNNLIRSILLEPLQQQFNASLQQQGITPESQPDVYQQQLQMFERLPQVQNYMNKEYRLEVEKWANHVIQLDNRRFRMLELEKKFFFNKLVTDFPFIHINLTEDDYRPEILDPKYCAYLKSPHSEDVSEGVMFTWFEYDTPLNIISRLGHKLNQDDIDKLQNLHTNQRTLLTIDSNARYSLDTPGILESAQNYLAFRELFGTNLKDDKHRGGEYKERLIEITNMYLKVPRKIGQVTITTGDQTYTKLVDENYTVNIKPVYDNSYSDKKNASTLVYGEHLEWMYLNETWRVVKINLSANPNPDNADDIWVVLEKFPIQLSDPRMKFGSYIPVHGGSVTNKYNDPISLVDKCKPWQVFYNYLWNRCDQLIKGEIGKFFALNQNVIPQESMGEEWGRSNLLKWALTARDTKIGPIDTSLGNTGQTNLGISGGYGQVIDLSATQEILEKVKLAEICKNECLLQVGASPQLLGDISPSETATGIQQGIQRSATQLKHLYDEHFSVFERVRQTMLEFAKYIDVTKGSVERMYVNDEGERIIFTIPTDLLIHQMGVFVSSNINDNQIIESVKNLVLFDNTLGADLKDKIAILSSKSVSEVHNKLKELTIEKEEKERQLIEQQNQQQRELIESQERQLQAKLQQEAAEKQLDRESQERQTEMKVIGQSQFSEGGGLEPLLELRKIQNQEKQTLRDHLLSMEKNRGDRQQAIDAAIQNDSIEREKISLEKEKIQAQREKILSDLKKSQNDLLIAKTNRNRYSKK